MTTTNLPWAAVRHLCPDCKGSGYKVPPWRNGRFWQWTACRTCTPTPQPGTAYLRGLGHLDFARTEQHA